MQTNIPKIMLIDMNSFFASVEQQANPFWRNRPVGIGNSIHTSSTLIGTSKEAKKIGIGTGTPVYKARKIDPRTVVVQSDPDKYREVNKRMNKIFSDYTDVVEPYSIDESFLDLRNSNLNPLVIGSEIKRRIKDEIGEWLTCSIGIGANKFLSKLAADLQKPDGLSIVWQSQLHEVYKHVKLRDLWGLARGWEKRLAKLNITSPGQLLGYPVQNLISLYGKPGYEIWERVNGFEVDEIRTSEQAPKTFGHSWVLNFRTTNKEKLKVVILRLAEKAARRMRREGFIASGIYLSVSMTDGNYLHNSRKLSFCINTGYELYEQAVRIWRNWRLTSEVMHIAVGFNYLSKAVEQLTLFPDKIVNLTPVLDKVNDRYGEFTIRSGLLTHTSDFAPDAIAFLKK